MADAFDNTSAGFASPDYRMSEKYFFKQLTKYLITRSIGTGITAYIAFYCLVDADEFLYLAMTKIIDALEFASTILGALLVICATICFAKIVAPYRNEEYEKEYKKNKASYFADYRNWLIFGEAVIVTGLTRLVYEANESYSYSYGYYTEMQNTIVGVGMTILALKACQLLRARDLFDDDEKEEKRSKQKS